LFLSFHYKRYNQNKADTTVNKTETCLLACSKLDFEYRTLCFDGALSAWFHFFGNAKFATGLDDLAINTLFSILEKIKIKY